MNLTGARWSSAARCPRQGAYTALATQGRDPDERTQRFFSRGRLYGWYVGQQYVAKHGADDVELEREIPWGSRGQWHGHADVFVRSERLLVEVYSTVVPSGLSIEHKLTQLRGYVAHDPDAERGVLYLIDPSDLGREDVLPVTLTDEHRAQVAEIVAQVERAVETNGDVMPPCAAASPTECRFARCCAFTDIAWAGWEPPTIPEIEGDPELAELLLLWAAAKSRETNLTAPLATTKAERKQIEERLAAYPIPAGKCRIGGFEVVRTEVKGRETFSYAKARSTGAWLPALDETLGPFVSIVEPSTRWAVKRLDSAVATAEDFGDEAPWTAADLEPAA